MKTTGKSIVGGPNTHITNSRWRMPSRKNQKANADNGL